jgi:hypothetical protein
MYCLLKGLFNNISDANVITLRNGLADKLQKDGAMSNLYITPDARITISLEMMTFISQEIPHVVRQRRNFASRYELNQWRQERSAYRDPGHLDVTSIHPATANKATLYLAANIRLMRTAANMNTPDACPDGIIPIYIVVAKYDIGVQVWRNASPTPTDIDISQICFNCNWDHILNEYYPMDEEQDFVEYEEKVVLNCVLPKLIFVYWK